MIQEENSHHEADVNIQKTPSTFSPTKLKLPKKVKKKLQPNNPSYYSVLDDEQIESI
jgi:hypothetical protein